MWFLPKAVIVLDGQHRYFQCSKPLQKLVFVKTQIIYTLPGMPDAWLLSFLLPPVLHDVGYIQVIRSCTPAF